MWYSCIIKGYYSLKISCIQFIFLIYKFYRSSSVKCIPFMVIDNVLATVQLKKFDMNWEQESLLFGG